jgi:Tol biopolymer transport system component
VLVYQPTNGKDLQLGWFDRDGRPIRRIGAHNDYVALRLSPDEERLAFIEKENFSSNGSIWVMELARGGVSRETNLPQTSLMPVWSPDGHEILFSSGNEQSMRLLRQPLNSSKPVTVLDTPGPKFLTDWSTDGRFITYFTSWPEFARLKTVVLDLRNAGQKTSEVLFMEGQYSETEAVFSPDFTSTGPRWIAYTSKETGPPEVYVRSFSQGDQKRQISTGGAWQPLWRRDGRELFFLSQDGMLMATDIGAGANLQAGAPHPLFRTTIPYTGSPHIPKNAYAVSRDGRRFLVNQTADDTSKSTLSIITHWQAIQP